jgi:hypothetical protein
MPQGESNITKIAQKYLRGLCKWIFPSSNPESVNILVRGLITMLGHMVVDQILSGLMTTSA